MRTELGPTAAELAQLFPQLADGPPTAPAGDPAQAKLRLFESVVTLLELWARDRGLLLVLDDVHWADELDARAPRLRGPPARRSSRVMLLATYRSDELDRRHPLTRTVQIWRRPGLAETVTVSAMTPAQRRRDDRGDPQRRRGERRAREPGRRARGGQPVRARGDAEGGARPRRDRPDRRPAGSEGRSTRCGMPETVREAVLLRLGRLDAEQIDVLRAAAVLGRSFDYGLLVERRRGRRDGRARGARVRGRAAASRGGRGRERTATRWRHALTQEAIASDTVVPKRQRIHSRAADALARDRRKRDGGRPPSARSRPDRGGRRRMPARGRRSRARGRVQRGGRAARARAPARHRPRASVRSLLARMGHLRWLNGEPAAAEQLLADGDRAARRARAHGRGGAGAAASRPLPLGARPARGGVAGLRARAACARAAKALRRSSRSRT